MSENIENQEISEQMEIDRRAKLQLWTTEKYKEEFKSFEGATDNEKLINILEIANKYKDKVDSFSIKNDIDVIERAFKSISMKFANIQDTVNMYEEDLVKSNMEQLIEIKNSIIKEEILNSKIIQIEKERDTFEERLKKEESMLISCQNRVKELEESNRSLTQKNSDLVHEESNNTKLLRQKEIEINNINQQNEKSLQELNLRHTNELKAKEEEVKKIKDELQNQEKQHKDKIIELDKEKIELSGQIDKYKGLLEVSNKNLENNKIELEELRNTHKKELQEVRDSSKEELKELQVQVQQANKEEAKAQSKLEMKEQSITELKEELKEKEKSYQDKVDDLEVENNTLKEEITRLKEELNKNKKK